MAVLTQISVEEFKSTYTLKSKIGTGGAGEVYLAHHNRLLKDVVIKKLYSVIKSNSQQRAEVDILKNLHHNYLPQVYDFFIMNGECYTVMEFIEGSSFKQLLDQNVRFSEQQILKYSRQLCDVVRYLHSQQFPVIHGDIKPDNIILTPEDDICLIDFNISSVAIGGIAFTFGRTMGYSPPEQIMAYEQLKAMGGNASNSQGIRIDKRSDVFSIGATMFHMYAGERLDRSPGIKVSDQNSDALIGIINKALSSNPADRYQDAGEFYDALCGMGNRERELKSIGVGYTIAKIIFGLMVVAGILICVYGYSSLGQERIDRYYEYVENMEKAIKNQDEDALEKNYKAAVKMDSSNAQAYYQYAAYYYEMGNYHEAIDFIHDSVPDDGDLTDDDYIAGIYDIYANCFYETEQYAQACEAWDTAIKYNDDDPVMYCNLAVAYAKNDMIDDAEEILEKADEYDISDDGAYLITAEIYNANGDYEDAIDYFEDCINETEDETTLYHAYVGYSSALRVLGDSSTDKNYYYDRNIELLNRASNEVDDQYKLSFLKREADIARIAYTYNQNDGNLANKYYVQAANAYAKIEETGWMNETEYYNYIDLNIKVKKFDEASRIQQNMDNAYSDSLLAAESHAFLERQIQLDKPAPERDYAAFCEYYLAAKKIADKNGKSDERLTRLAEIYKEVC